MTITHQYNISIVALRVHHLLSIIIQVLFIVDYLAQTFVVLARSKTVILYSYLELTSIIIESSTIHTVVVLHVFGVGGPL